jgi:hypothetical protein
VKHHEEALEEGHLGQLGLGEVALDVAHHARIPAEKTTCGTRQNTHGTITIMERRSSAEKKEEYIPIGNVRSDPLDQTHGHAKDNSHHLLEEKLEVNQNHSKTISDR